MTNEWKFSGLSFVAHLAYNSLREIWVRCENVRLLGRFKYSYIIWKFEKENLKLLLEAD